MKKLFIAAVLFISAFSGVNAQDNNKSNNNVTREGKTYEILLSKNGRAFILRISKTGKDYRKYLGEEISRRYARRLDANMSK